MSVHMHEVANEIFVHIAFIDTEQYLRIRTSERKEDALETNIYRTKPQLKKHNIIDIS